MFPPQHKSTCHSRGAVLFRLSLPAGRGNRSREHVSGPNICTLFPSLPASIVLISGKIQFLIQACLCTPCVRMNVCLNTFSTHPLSIRMHLHCKWEATQETHTTAEDEKEPCAPKKIEGESSRYCDVISEFGLQSVLQHVTSMWIDSFDWPQIHSVYCVRE